MVVVDGSTLIPLAWVGRLELLHTVFERVETTTEVRDEVLVEGERGTAALESFLQDVTVHETTDDAERLARLEGVALGDASVVLLAEEGDARLLANDRGLIEVARSRGVDCWWVTTLLLKCVKDGHLSRDEASDVLYDLVDEGMNLSPKVYTRVQREFERLDDRE
jgi:predicted nucleic acid-binding protein